MPKARITRGGSSNKRRKIDFQDAPEGGKGGSGQ
jgi:hypothetical protein